jgi:hypothetical protein
MGSLSVAETLLSAGIIGIIYAVLSGQPLVLIGITGYVIIYCIYSILYICILIVLYTVAMSMAMAR